MLKRYTYREKINTELEIVEARFATFKFKAKHLTSGDRLEHAKHVEEIEKHVEATKAKLRELDEARDDVWEELSEGVEHTWGALQATLQDAVENFKN